MVTRERTGIQHAFAMIWLPDALSGMPLRRVEHPVSFCGGRIPMSHQLSAMSRLSVTYPLKYPYPAPDRGLFGLSREKLEQPWLNIEYVLGLFSEHEREARR